MTSGNKMGLPAWSQSSTDSKEQSRIRATILTHPMKSFSPLIVVNNLTFMNKIHKLSISTMLYVIAQLCTFILRCEAVNMLFTVHFHLFHTLSPHHFNTYFHRAANCHKRLAALVYIGGFGAFMLLMEPWLLSPSWLNETSLFICIGQRTKVATVGCKWDKIRLCDLWGNETKEQDGS